MEQEKRRVILQKLYILIVLEDLQFQNLCKELKLRALSLIHSAKNVLDDLTTTLGAGLGPYGIMFIRDISNAYKLRTSVSVDECCIKNDLSIQNVRQPKSTTSIYN